MELITDSTKLDVPVMLQPAAHFERWLNVGIFYGAFIGFDTQDSSAMVAALDQLQSRYVVCTHP